MAIEVHVVVELIEIVDRAPGSGRVVGGGGILDKPMENTEIGIEDGIDADSPVVLVGVESVAIGGLLGLCAVWIDGNEAPAGHLAVLHC